MKGIALALGIVLTARVALADCGTCTYVGTTKVGDKEVEICDCRQGGSPPPPPAKKKPAPPKPPTTTA